MPTYTITVGAADGLIAGYYGFAPAVPGAWSTFGSVSPPGSVVYAFYWAPDGSLVSIEADTPGGDLSVVWNSQVYTLADQGGGYAAYQDVGLGGPYPTSGTADFDSDAASGGGGITLLAGQGVFQITGYPVTFVRTRTIFAEAGAFTITGNDVGFGRGYAATITVGNFGGFSYGYQSGSYGSIAWSGTPPPNPPTAITWISSGFAVQMVSPVPGDIVLNGQTYTLSGSDGSYTVSTTGLGGPYPTSGTLNILFLPGGTYAISAGTGAFTLSGSDVDFIFPGPPPVVPAIAVTMRPGGGPVAPVSYEVGHRLAGASDWTVAPLAAVSGTLFLPGYTAGQSVELRARAASISGAWSDWSAVTSHTVGSSDPTIRDVATFAATWTGTAWHYAWALEVGPVSVEPAGIKIRHGLGVGLGWDDIDDLHTGLLTVSPWDLSAPPATPGTHTFGACAVTATGAYGTPVLVTVSV